MAKISLFTVIFGYQRTSTNALAGPWRSGAGGVQVPHGALQKSLETDAKDAYQIVDERVFAHMQALAEGSTHAGFRGHHHARMVTSI